MDYISDEIIKAAATVLEESSFTDLSPAIAENLAEEILVAAFGRFVLLWKEKELTS